MTEDGVGKGQALYVRPGDSVIMVWPKDTTREQIDEAMAICAEALPAVRILHVTSVDQVLVRRAEVTDREIEVGTWDQPLSHELFPLESQLLEAELARQKLRAERAAAWERGENWAGLPEPGPRDTE